MSVPESETLRSSDPPVDKASLSLLPIHREEDKGELQEEEDEEEDDSCHHCGAMESFEYFYFPDTGTFSHSTCNECGGPSMSTS